MDKERTYKVSPREPEELDNLIVDSYDRLVQLERRNLIIVSFLTFFSVITNINPQKATFLGFTFENFCPSYLYITLIILIIYFLSAYLIYGYPKYNEAIKFRKEKLNKAMTLTTHQGWCSYIAGNIRRNFKYISWLYFHYFLPVIMGVLSIIVGIIKIA